MARKVRFLKATVGRIYMISVIMSVYNEKIEWLQQAVESILAQTYTEFEYIIIVDNPSLNDKTVQYLRKIEAKDQRVKLRFNEKNLGLMNSLNLGLSMAKGIYIARMDADDISFSDRFEKEIRFIEDNDFDMVSANRIDIDENGNEISRTIHLKNTPEKYLPYSNFIVHPSVMVKTKVMKTLGGYREFYNTEDYDMWLRILSAGYKIGILDEYVIYYRIRQTSMSLKNKLETYYIAKYQQKLYWERVKYGEDSFSIENFKSYMDGKNISDKQNMRYCNFRENMDLAITKFKKRKSGFCIDFLKAFCAFPTIAIDSINSIIHIR